MFSGRASVRPSVRPSVIHLVVLCFRDISSICWRIFAKLLSLVHLGTDVNWLDFGVKRSKVKVTAWPTKFQTAISPERVVRLTSRLILGWGFRGWRIVWTYVRLHQIQDGGWPPSWIISNGHISAMGRPIDFAFDPMVRFLGTADRMDLLPVSPNLRRRLLMTSSRNSQLTAGYWQNGWLTGW